MSGSLKRGKTAVLNVHTEMSDEEEGVTAADQTQPEVDQFVKDIFGDSDSDESVKGGRGGGGGDDGLEDSDEEDGEKKTSRLKKGGLTPSKKDKKRDSSGKEDKASKKKSKKDKEGKKRKGDRQFEGSESKRAKRESKKVEAAPRPGIVDEGDDYDSDEVVANEDDDAFLADEDDVMLAGVVGEYNSEVQRFNDERPDGGTGASMKGKKGGGRGGGSSGGRPMDVFSQTLADMKKKKVAELTDIDKQRFATDLLQLMDTAAKKDDIAFEKKEPAVNKLNLLKKVQDMVGLKSMQSTLLDYDILGEFSDWITPKRDNSLPSHTIRTAIYHMLSILPAQSDHLKRKHEQTQRTIGMTIMSLFRHKQETRENKILLKSIIEKWSRPIFGKLSDARSSNYASNEELQDVVKQQQAKRVESLMNYETTGMSFDDAIAKGAADAYGEGRARRPYSNGFVFTARPEAKSVVDRQTQSGNDEARKNLLKKMHDMKGSNRTGVGRKASLKAMDMQNSGRNKA